jgi:hypothetical protein
MDVVQYNGVDGLAFALFIVLSFVVSWLLIYTAVAAAVGHALHHPAARMTADAHITPEGVEFVVANVGTGPAFDLSVRWQGAAIEPELAHTPLLQERATLVWVLAAPAEPDETLVVRQLELKWGSALNPAFDRRSALLAVLGPSRAALR